MAKAIHSYLLCLFFLFIFLPDVNARQTEADTAYFSDKRTRLKIPFKLVHNLIIIPVQINNSSPLNLILDSGVNSTIITKLYYSDSLELKDSEKIAIRGLGEGYTVEALVSKGNSLKLSKAQGYNQEIYVLLDDIFELSTRMGMPVHGIIGNDIFKNFIVKIDYSKEIITLYKPTTKIKIRKKAEVYPLYIENNKAYIEAHVKQYNGDPVQVKLVVDTGASHSLSLYLPTHEKLVLPPKVMEAYLGRGLSGDINGKIGRINGMKLGRYEFDDLPATYPDESAVKHALNIANRNGNLGSDILKRFTVIFDYPNNRLILEPNRKFKQPFNYNIAGFEVSTPMPGLNVYLVANVVKNSEAQEAGIKPGDQLISVNGQRCHELKLTDILHILESKPGKQVRLQLRRDEKPYEVTLTLRNRI
jgi:hypothetical protein